MKEFDKILTVTDAKRDLSGLVKEVHECGESVALTRNGYPAVVLLSVDEYEGLLETLEILSDPAAIKAIKKALRQAKAGRFVTDAEVWGA